MRALRSASTLAPSRLMPRSSISMGIVIPLSSARDFSLSRSMVTNGMNELAGISGWLGIHGSTLALVLQELSDRSPGPLP